MDEVVEALEPERKLSALQESVILLSRQLEAELTATKCKTAAGEDATLPPLARCELAKARVRRLAAQAR